MATQETLNQVQQLYVAYYGRPADAEGLAFWAEALEANGGDTSVIINDFGNSAEFEARFGEMTNEELVNNLYQQLFGRDAEEEGLAFYVGHLEEGNLSLAEIAAEIAGGAQDGEGNADATALANKIAAANLYTEATEGQHDGTDADNYAAEWLAGINADTDVEAIDMDEVVANLPEPTEPEEPGVPGETFNLTVGQDFVEGTAGDDTFVSYVAQNPNGQQVNTLGTGDVIDGGAGVDTLEAQVTTGAWVNGGGASNMAIGPVTRSVENIVLQAEIANFGVVQNDTVIVNAKDMEGVNKIASNHSDASLLVQNMTSKGVAGGTADMTVGMEYTGNADSAWDESDMAVYFDQDYLTRSTVQSNSLYYFTQDRLATQQDEKPFGENTAVDGLVFHLDGERVEITIPQDELEAFLEDVPTGRIAAYEEFTALLQEALAAKNAEMNGALDGFTITLDTNFQRTHGGSNNQGDPLSMPAPAITLTAPDGVAIDTPSMHQNARDLPTYDMYNDTDDESTVTDTPVSINVDLEKVGLAADGGDLVIGSMNKNGENVFGINQGITVTDTVAGFDEFNVHVAGGKGQNSSLASLHSTDNTLRKVTVDSKEDGDANLTIGNSNTAATTDGEVIRENSAGNAQAFKDVQVLDASQFNGDLTLFAGITDESVEKYLANTTETTLYGLNDAGDELALFEYQGGNGNDVLDIRIDGSIIDGNLVGTDDAGVVDTNGFNVFEMNIDGGAGDDLIVVTMDAGSDASGASNITINGGLGNDIIDISQGVEGESTDWTFTVAFSGSHFGHDTIIGFDAGEVDISDEEQTLDLGGFVAHVGERIVITVGDQTLAPIAITADMGDMGADAIATAVAEKLDEGDDAFFDDADADGATIDLTRLGQDQKRVTVEIQQYNEETGTWELGMAPVHTATSEVQSQGGIREGGSDVLDFSSYGATGVVFDGETFGDTSNSSDVIIEMIVSAHNPEVYNVSIDEVVIGSIEFVGGIDASLMNADSFVFAA